MSIESTKITSPGRVCLRCAHFKLDTGMPTYSEHTPGEPARMGCRKDRWAWAQNDDDEISFRAKMLTAQSCTDFKHYKKEG